MIAIDSNSGWPSTSSTGTFPRGEMARNQSGLALQVDVTPLERNPFFVDHHRRPVHVRAERVAHQLQLHDGQYDSSTIAAPRSRSRWRRSPPARSPPAPGPIAARPTCSPSTTTTRARVPRWSRPSSHPRRSPPARSRVSGSATSTAASSPSRWSCTTSRPPTAAAAICCSSPPRRTGSTPSISTTTPSIRRPLHSPRASSSRPDGSTRRSAARRRRSGSASPARRSSTPRRGRCYAVARNADDHQYYLHALDLTAGAARSPPAGPHRAGGSRRARRARCEFNADCQRNRPALLLEGGVVYVAFGSLACDRDCPDGTLYRGWVVGYRAADLAEAAVFCTGADRGHAGIWQGGAGLVGAGGRILFHDRQRSGRARRRVRRARGHAGAARAQARRPATGR